ncbi:hypothetical protein [Arthrobacter sp. CAN_A1]|uniref:hypothetical protein n=1 Tax=Arthrobacter sp. CAN_A1 TaxID=2787717 RepID=UPI0018C95E70
MTAVSFAGVPTFADSDLLDTEAGSIKTAGARVNEIAANCSTVWTELGAVYHAPESAQVLAAFTPVDAFAEETQTVSALIATALTDFAATVRTLKTTYNALVLDAGQTSGSEDDSDEAAAADRETQILVDQLARDYEEAEATCIAALGAASGQVYSPGWADTLGIGTSTVNEIADRVQHSQVHVRVPLETVRSPRVFDLELGPPIRPTGPLHMDDMPYDYIDAQGKKWTQTPSGVLVRTGTTVDVGRPPIDGENYRRSTPQLTTPDRVTSPPDWARNAGRGLFVVDVGMTVWSHGTSQYNEDLVNHPGWTDGQRAASVTEDLVIVGGASLAGGAAGALAGAKGGAILGAAIGSVIPGAGTAAGALVGGILGAVGGGIIGSNVGEQVGEGIKDVWNSLWD